MPSARSFDTLRASRRLHVVGACEVDGRVEWVMSTCVARLRATGMMMRGFKQRSVIMRRLATHT